jgi:hypothetical protein
MLITVCIACQLVKTERFGYNEYPDDHRNGTTGEGMNIRWNTFRARLLHTQPTAESLPNSNTSKDCAVMPTTYFRRSDDGSNIGRPPDLCPLLKSHPEVDLLHLHTLKLCVELVRPCWISALRTSALL